MSQDNSPIALHYAVSSNNIEECVKLLQDGTDINQQDLYGNTALHLAVKNRNKGIVEILLDHGADTDIKLNGFVTALHIALRSMQIDMANLLLDKGARTDIKDNVGDTAFHIALKFFSDISYFATEKSSIIKHKESTKKIFERLLSKTDSIYFIENKIESFMMLCWAAYSSHKDIVSILLEKGVDPNPTDEYDDKPPLFWAIRGAHPDPEIVELLLSKGASPSSDDIKLINQHFYNKDKNTHKSIGGLLIDDIASISNLGDIIILPIDNQYNNSQEIKQCENLFIRCNSYICSSTIEAEHFPNILVLSAVQNFQLAVDLLKKLKKRYISDNKLDKVNKLLKIAVNRLSVFPEAYGTLGEFYFSQNDYTESRKYLTKAYRNHSLIAPLYLGILYQLLLPIESSLETAEFLYSQADYTHPLKSLLLFANYLSNPDGQVNRVHELCMSYSSDLASYAKLDYPDWAGNYNTVVDIAKQIIDNKNEVNQKRIFAAWVLVLVFNKGILGFEKNKDIVIKYVDILSNLVSELTTIKMKMMLELDLSDIYHDHIFSEDTQYVFQTIFIDNFVKSIYFLFCKFIGLINFVFSKFVGLINFLWGRYFNLDSNPEYLLNLDNNNLTPTLTKAPTAFPIAIVLDNLKPDRDDMLSVNRKEELYIISNEENNRCLCLNTKGQIGLVPNNFLHKFKLNKGVDNFNDKKFELSLRTKKAPESVKTLLKNAIQKAENGDRRWYFEENDLRSYHKFASEIYKTKIKGLNDDNPIVIKKSSRLKELENLVALCGHHENIVNFIGHFNNEYVLFNYENGQSLFNKLALNAKGICPFSTMERLYVARDIARGLSFLHSRNFVHGDIKTSNVILYKKDDGSCGAKIIDFESGDFLIEKQDFLLVKSHDFTKVAWWPDEHMHNSKLGFLLFTKRADVFQTAHMYAQMFSSLNTSAETCERVAYQGGKLFTIEDHKEVSFQNDIEPNLESVIKLCLSRESYCRPRIDDILMILELILRYRTSSSSELQYSFSKDEIIQTPKITDKYRIGFVMNIGASIVPPMDHVEQSLLNG